MVLNLHIRFVDMDICTFILLSSLPIVWIAVGCLLLILLLIVTILFVLKSREVAMLKKQCEDLSETMRMMRYEEANLSRMLHTASKSVERPVAFAAVPEESEQVEQTEQAEPIATIVDAEESNELVESDGSIDVEGAVELEELEEAAILEEVVAPEEAEETQAIVEESQVVEALEEEQTVEEPIAPQPHKQAINERRPAIPTDLFAAWFAENEDTASEESVVVETEKEEAEVVSSEKSEVAVLPQEATSETKVEVVADVADTVVVAANQDIAPEPSVTEAVALQEEETVAEVSDIDAPVGLSKEDERFCRKLERIVNTRLRNPNLNIDIIAAQFGIGRTNFYRKVRELMGISPNDYLRKCRMERAAELLCSSELPVNDICAQVGMPDAQYFSRVFKAYFGVSPSIYREQHNQ